MELANGHFLSATDGGENTRLKLVLGCWSSKLDAWCQLVRFTSRGITESCLPPHVLLSLRLLVPPPSAAEGRLQVWTATSYPFCDTALRAERTNNAAQRGPFQQHHGRLSQYKLLIPTHKSRAHIITTIRLAIRFGQASIQQRRHRLLGSKSIRVDTMLDSR